MLSSLTNAYSENLLKVSFSVVPNTYFTLTPSTPLIVSASDQDPLSLIAPGLQISATGVISGVLKPVSSQSGQPLIINEIPHWAYVITLGGQDIYFNVSFVIASFPQTTISNIKVTPPTHNPTEKSGNVAFNWVPPLSAKYRVTIELVTQYRTLSPSLSDVPLSGQAKKVVPINTGSWISLPAGTLLKTSLDIFSNPIVLPDYYLDPDAKGIEPINLPAGTTYRIRIASQYESPANGPFYVNSSTTSSEFTITWPKKPAPKPSAPKAAATSKSGELLVTGITDSVFWNYPTMPQQIRVHVEWTCKSGNYWTTCSTERYFDKLAPNGSALVGGLVGGTSYKVSVWLVIDPHDPIWETGAMSDYSASVTAKK